MCSTLFLFICIHFLDRGSDSHPPGGFVNLLKKNTPSPAQVVSNGSSSQPINIGDDTNDGDGARTEKRLLWTKEEDLRLVRFFYFTLWPSSATFVA